MVLLACSHRVVMDAIASHTSTGRTVMLLLSIPLPPRNRQCARCGPNSITRLCRSQQCTAVMEVMGLSAMLLSVHQPSMTARCNTQQCELCQGVERVDGRRGDAIDADVRGWMTGASAEQHVRHTAMRCCQHQLQGQGQRCTCMLESPTRTSCCGGGAAHASAATAAHTAPLHCCRQRVCDATSSRRGTNTALIGARPGMTWVGSAGTAF